MRSFTSSQAADMDHFFRFSLLLTYLSVIESATKSCLSQPDNAIWLKTGQTAVLNCTVSSHCSTKDLNYEWFVFTQNDHCRLNLDINKQKYELDGASLHIKSLNTSDSGIYYCAAVSKEKSAPGAQHIGTGTTLVVNEALKRKLLLWLSFVLLAIYSLTVVALIILKKHGCNKCDCKRMYTTSDKNNSTRKTQFRDVLQEMYSRRNLERSKHTVNRNSSQVEAASTELNSSIDDVYQNV